MVRRKQQQTFYQGTSRLNNTTSMPNFELLAKAYGIKGMVIHWQDELKGLIMKSLAHNSPYVSWSLVPKDERHYPMGSRQKQLADDWCKT